nr:HAMP domain-containing histidine kinase [Gammaproteobacteria bacterium]
EEQFTNETGGYIIFLDTSSGSYKVKESKYTTYEVDFISSGEKITAHIPSFTIDIREEDIISAWLKKEGNRYVFERLVINGLSIIQNKTFKEEYIVVENVEILEVRKPSNLNYLYEKMDIVQNGIDTISKNMSSLKSFKDQAPSPYSSAYYYLDQTNSILYSIYTPLSLKEAGVEEIVLAIFPMIRTQSILSTISSYYGYIVLVSVVFAVLIALYIARSFSNPIKDIEREMINLGNSKYKLSNYKFKNRELVSLQTTLNQIKVDTKLRVESIESQKNTLEKLNDELKRESDLRSTFIARLSHELKTPLMVISATAEALEDGIIKEDEIDSSYQTILDEVDKATSIIKDIINTYKNTSTNKDSGLKMVRFNLNELVNDTLSTLEPLYEKKRFTMARKYDSTVYISADKEMIKEVISNYLTNAFKYTEEGQKIEINIKELKDCFRFEVKNYGSFISEENLTKIWLPFFREKEDVDKSSTGMGLYLVKEILEKHSFNYNVTNFEEGVISYFEVKK